MKYPFELSAGSIYRVGSKYHFLVVENNTPIFFVYCIDCFENVILDLSRLSKESFARVEILYEY